MIRRWPVLAAGALALLLSPGVAEAHPLGDFSVNHYHGLLLHRDRIDVLSVVDTAEIPTLQERADLDTDGGGTVSEDESAAAAPRRCAELAGAVESTVDGSALRWEVRSARLEHPRGPAALPTTRLTCALTAPVAVDRPVAVSFRDTSRPDRIGWREITASGDGVVLSGAGVPARSVTDELREYPDDLLGEPLDVREVELRAEPGAGSAGGAAASEPDGPGLPSALASTVTGLVGDRDASPWAGVLAVLLSLVLGASHAALPGHGKTIIAAYLAGRHGTARDALVVGASVTATHTGGVLVLGLLISASSGLAGEVLLRWLGVVSGLLVAGIGVLLLRSALRARPLREPVAAGPGHGHGHGTGHGHGHGTGRAGLIGVGAASGLVPSPSALVVLLGAVALGRTWFGVLLVVGYGLGMAAVLVVAGLALVLLRDRAERVTTGPVHAWVGRASAVAPVVTAAAVVVLGGWLAVGALTG
ncbi:nickel/cobalt transporter [Umezawaea beigongshangensis]|uniref:nickel/cobalt transporter n=1 Tax=Umezawaea beigongshangensis TaxID=2780383 RepID=UPI001E424715|nr:High-affinity nickel-transporter [Umezawaea beigongshangensis]